MIVEKRSVPLAGAPFRDFLGLVPGVVSAWEAVCGGANSRAWRVESSEGTYFLKEYYRGGVGERDRGSSERAFYRLAGERASDQVPKPVAWGPDNRAGLFQWVEGRKLAASEITADHLEQAFDFFARLNQPPLPAAEFLPDAEETAASVGGHLQIVENRLMRLAELSGEAGDFVRQEVIGLWVTIRESARIHEALSGARCISPSDFGFHNALLGKDGRLKFFDFEYGGWDDPAKMAADFVNQVRVPPPANTQERLMLLLAKLFPGDSTAVQRFQALEPVYRIKWVCIILNEFLPTKKSLHLFANPNDDLPTRKKQKLMQARAHLRCARLKLTR
jgi:hypothetical protein